MKHFKKLAVVVAILGVLGTAGVAYAATTKTPAEVVSVLTGKTIQDVTKERAAGKTYGTIAKDAGKLDQFKVQMLELRKEVLDQGVKDGTITQERADILYNAMKSNQAACDGTGKAGLGMKKGAGCASGGCGLGNGQGRGAGRGMGRGMGAGRGFNK